MTDANRRFLESHDHLQDLGITLESQSEGSVTLSLPFDDSLANPGTGVMQGGVVATLIDHAGGAAIRTTLEDPAGTPHASTELNVSYVRPASGDLTAEASVVRSGTSMGVVAVEVTTTVDGVEKVVAVGRVSLHLERETDRDTDDIDDTDGNHNADRDTDDIDGNHDAERDTDDIDDDHDVDRDRVTDRN